MPRATVPLTASQAVTRGHPQDDRIREEPHFSTGPPYCLGQPSQEKLGETQLSSYPQSLCDMTEGLGW